MITIGTRVCEKSGRTIKRMYVYQKMAERWRYCVNRVSARIHNTFVTSINNRGRWRDAKLYTFGNSLRRARLRRN